MTLSYYDNNVIIERRSSAGLLDDLRGGMSSYELESVEPHEESVRITGRVKWFDPARDTVSSCRTTLNRRDFATCCCT